MPEGPKVGDSVTYSPSGTYNWQAKYYSSTSSFDDATLNSANGENFNLIKWRVLSIENGRVELVPNEPTSGTVHLRESQGYNNGVKLLNDACSSLYGNTSKGITARSLNIDDIEKYMLEAKLTEAHSYTGNAKYGNQVSSAYTRYYPVMYEREKLSVINGSKKTDGLGMSEQTNFIEKTDSGASNGYSNALTSIQPYQTYWYKDNTYMQNAFRTAEGGTNYYDLLIKTSTNYWLASRCVQTYSDDCGFYMRRVYSGGINAFNICYQINRKYLWLQLCAISRSFSKR